MQAKQIGQEIGREQGQEEAKQQRQRQDTQSPIVMKELLPFLSRGF